WLPPGLHGGGRCGILLRARALRFTDRRGEPASESKRAGTVPAQPSLIARMGAAPAAQDGRGAARTATSEDVLAARSLTLQPASGSPQTVDQLAERVFPPLNQLPVVGGLGAVDLDESV